MLNRTLLPTTTALLLAGSTLANAQGIPKLVDIAEEVGIRQQGLTWSATVADFNQDERPDVYVSWHSDKRGSLFMNQKGERFGEKKVGDKRDRHDCDAADVDQDGRMDLFCTVGANEDADPGDNNLFLQLAPGEFTDMAVEWGVRDRWGRGRMTTFIDANGDEYPDLFVGNTPRRPDERETRNRLFLNVEGKRFRNAKGFGLDHAEGAECVQAIDTNGNGFEDLLLCAKETMKLYLNTRGKGFRLAKVGVVPTQRWPRAQLVDVRGANKPELVTLEPKVLKIMARAGAKFSKEIEKHAMKGATAFAPGDVDGDGDMDLFVVHNGCAKGEETYSHSRDVILLNNGPFFIPLPVPAPEAGCGQSVEAIDYNSDGTDEFFVLNGRGETPGYLQLIDLRLVK